MARDSNGENSYPERIPIRELAVPVPWGEIAAKCWGDPGSDPVLVVHGLQDNAGSFDRLLPLLPRGFYYICMELPGHGKSSRMPKGQWLDFMSYVSVIYRFVRHLSLTRFHYLGHSLGGQLGVYYAAMYPEHVIKLITLDTLPTFEYTIDEFLPFHKDMTEKMLKLEEKMAKGSPPSYTYEEAVNRTVSQRSFPISRAAGEALVERSLREGKSGYHFSTDQRLKFGVRSCISSEWNIRTLTKVRCPFLLIITKISVVGAETGQLPREVMETAKKMKNITVAVVDGFHDVHNDDPHVVAPHICKFLVRSKSNL